MQAVVVPRVLLFEPVEEVAHDGVLVRALIELVPARVPRSSVDVLGLEDLERSIVELHAHRRRDEARSHEHREERRDEARIVDDEVGVCSAEEHFEFSRLGPGPGPSCSSDLLCARGHSLLRPFLADLRPGGVQVPLVDDDSILKFWNNLSTVHNRITPCVILEL